MTIKELLLSLTDKELLKCCQKGITVITHHRGEVKEETKSIAFMLVDVLELPDRNIKAEIIKENEKYKCIKDGAEVKDAIFWKNANLDSLLKEESKVKIVCSILEEIYLRKQFKPMDSSSIMDGIARYVKDHEKPNSKKYL